MILIASASYCREDIAVEIGSLPPSFLPIGNQRLFELQYLLLQKIDEEIWLSLPEGFEISNKPSGLLLADDVVARNQENWLKEWVMALSQ